MSTELESAAETAVRMVGRWGQPPARTMLDFGGGVCANWMHAQPAEVFAEPSSAHIIALTVDGERFHRQWRDGRLIYNGALPARAINIVPSGQAPRAVLSEPMRALHLYIPGKSLESEAMSCDAWSGTGAIELIDPAFSPDPALVALAEQAAAAMHGNSPLDRLWRESLAAAICARLLQRWSNLRERWPAATQLPNADDAARDWRVRRAIDYLDAHLAVNVGLEELAAVVGVSTRHLTTLFTAGTGEPPHRWLMHRRFERACELLGDPRRSVTDVAHSCGFASSQHLATVFRKQFGTTPKEWRRARQM